MVSILTAWVQGALLGLGVAAPIGPINVEIIRRHLGFGTGAGLLIGLGACSVDTAYILLISLGLVTAAPGPAAQAVLLAGGAAILIVLAGLTIHGARASAQRAAEVQAAVAPPARLARHYLVGLAMTATSPMNLVFWLGVVASGQYAGQTPWGPWPRIAGVLCGTVGWVVGLNGALRLGRQWVRPRLLGAVNLASAAILLGFAAWSLWRMATIISRQ